jgi:dTDP-glucose 4,6-dehydratase
MTPGSAILVTGGAGFIGSAVVRRLVRAGRTVVNVDALTYAGNLDSLAAAADAQNHHFVQLDICDEAGLRDVFDTYRPGSVLHLAAESHVDRSIDAPHAFMETNVLGTFRLLQAARQHYARLAAAERDAFRFIHVSTDEVFGSLADDDPAFHSRTPYDPRSPYSASKAGADHLARAWAHTYGLPVIVTNCSNNYGPFQFPEKLIPLMILTALREQPLPVYGDGSNVRDWIHVEDHVSGLLAALEHGRPGDTFLFGGDAERRNLDVVLGICRILDELRPSADGPRSRLISYVTDRPGHDFRYAIDTAEARARLDWQPERTFETGLRETVEWYLEHREWVERVQSGAYRQERLGSVA